MFVMVYGDLELVHANRAGLGVVWGRHVHQAHEPRHPSPILRSRLLLSFLLSFRGSDLGIRGRGIRDEVGVYIPCRPGDFGIRVGSIKRCVGIILHVRGTNRVTRLRSCGRS